MRVAPLSTRRQMTTSMNPHQRVLLVHHRTRLSTLKTNSSRRSSSSRLARAHERAGRGRAGRASKRRHRGRTVALLVCSRAAQSFVSGPRQLPVVVAIQVFGPFSLSTDGYNLEYNIPRHLPGNAVTRATCRNVKPRNSGFGSKLYRLRDIWANGAW